MNKSLVINIIICLILYVLVQFGESPNTSIIGFIIMYAYRMRYLFKSDFKKGNRSNLVSFNTFFFLMYTMVTYLIPIFVLLNNSDQIDTVVVFDNEYIVKALLVCAFAETSYIVGYLHSYKKNATYKYSDMPNTFIVKKIGIIKFLSVIGTVVFIMAYRVAVSQGQMDVSGKTTTIVDCCLILPMAITGFLNKEEKKTLLPFLLKNRIVFGCTGFIIVALLAIGDRMTPLCLICSSIFIINEFVYKFSFKQLFVGGVTGIFLMFLISSTRHSGVNLAGGFKDYQQMENKATLFQDIFPINADLILGSEMYEKNGAYKPLRIIPLALSPVPYLPNYIKYAFFDGEITTGMELTLYNRKLMSYEYRSGIGTHCVVDIFMSWGWIGVILFFYFFGKIVGQIQLNRKTFYGVIAYSGLIAWSIYMARETLFDPYRDVVWMICIAYLIYGNSRKIINL